MPRGVRYSFNYRIRTKEEWKTLIRFDNAHRIKGHKKRDHKHVFENGAQELEFNTPNELIDELLKLIDDNRRIINEIKRH
ncbi:MAG: toxin-antitoxin system TumE family protein [Methanosarcinales archaeon]